MSEIRLHGYTDRLNVKTGSHLVAYVSAEGTNEVQAQLVRLVHGDAHPDGPGFIEREIDSPINRAWPVARQYTQQGNFLQVGDPGHLLQLAGHAITLYAFVYPTLLGQERQTLLGRWDLTHKRGAALGLNPKGQLEFWCGDGEYVDAVAAEVPLLANIWYFVAATFDPRTRLASVHQIPVINRYNSLFGKVVPFDGQSHVQLRLRVQPVDPETGFLIGGAHEHNPARGTFVAQCYNGKIDRPGVLQTAADRACLDALAKGQQPANDVLAHWDTSAGYTTHGIGDLVTDTGPHNCMPPASTARCAARPAGTGMAGTTAFASIRPCTAALSSMTTR